MMEKMLKPYEREHMKMVMLKHEETFKQQVYELHRLYRIQNTLMDGVDQHYKPKRPNHKQFDHGDKYSLNRTNKNPTNLLQYSKPRVNIEELNGDKELEYEDESEIQLTLGPTRYKKTEISDSGPSFSSYSTGSSHIKNQENLDWGLTMVTTVSNSSYRSKKNGYHVKSQPSQGRPKLNQPPWFLQALSNMA